jgi:hypothetical protein
MKSMKMTVKNQCQNTGKLKAGDGKMAFIMENMTVRDMRDVPGKTGTINISPQVLCPGIGRGFA